MTSNENVINNASFRKMDDQEIRQAEQDAISDAIDEANTEFTRLKLNRDALNNRMNDLDRYRDKLRGAWYKKAS